MLWIAGELLLGAVVIAGFASALGLYALLARLLLPAVEHLILRTTLGRLPGLPSLRLGLASLRRHSTASKLQATALGLGLTALLLLTVARQDLLASWQRNLPPDAPGFDAELDELRLLSAGADEFLVDLERRERRLRQR